MTVEPALEVGGAPVVNDGGGFVELFVGVIEAFIEGIAAVVEAIAGSFSL